MAYHGYLSLMTQYCQNFYKLKNKPPKILEIGVDTGITAFSLYNNLNMLNCPIEYTGVDIILQNHVREFFKSYMTMKNEKTKINLVEENSLLYLKKIIEKKEKFDIILIDGDHNYKTVEKECKYLKDLFHHDTLFIFDDYNGRYSSKDMFYSSRPGYEEKTKLAKYSDGPQGIKKPIDDFINQENLNSFMLMDAEPLCVIHKDNKIIKLEQGNG
jgi:predicted O-methyltransferase YrrM